MKKETYISPKIEIISMESAYFLEGISEDFKEAAIFSDGELDANGSAFWDYDIPSNKLWDE